MTLLALLLLWQALSMGQTVCPPRPVDRTMKQVVESQPGYINIIPAYVESLGLDTSLVDNICLTYFPLDDCYQSSIVYASLVLSSGTNAVLAYLVKSNETGVMYYSSPSQSNLHIVIKTDGTTDYVYQLEGDYGFVYGITAQWKQYPDNYECVLNNLGFGDQHYIRLPMDLPPQCVTWIRCSADCRGCHTNNKQTRYCQTNNSSTNTSPTNNCPTNNCPTNNCPTSNCPTNNCPTNKCTTNNCPTNNCPTNKCPTNNCPTNNCPTNNCPTNKCPTNNCPTNNCPPYDCSSDDYAPAYSYQTTNFSPRDNNQASVCSTCNCQNCNCQR